MAITTPKGILSYPHLFTPQAPAGFPNSPPKYGCTIIFPEGTDVGQLKDAYMAAGNAKWGAGKWPALEKKNMALRKGKDVKGTPEKYAECFCLVAKSDPEHGGRPALVHNDTARTEIIDRAELYGGAIVQARVNFFAYDTGVGCGLNGILKIGDCDPDDRLDSRESKDEMFSGIEASEDAGPKAVTPGNGAAAPDASPAAADPWE